MTCMTYAHRYTCATGLCYNFIGLGQYLAFNIKPKDPVWNMFTVCEMNGKNVAICKDCNSSVSAKD